MLEHLAGYAVAVVAFAMMGWGFWLYGGSVMQAFGAAREWLFNRKWW
jgi:hypothetical protein